jgi:hypothetical protein
MSFLRKRYKTDPKVEQRGVEVDLDGAIVTIARAGGTNKKYKKALSKALKPFRAAIDADNLDDDRALPAIVKVFVDEVLLNWQTEVDGKLVTGIEGVDGSVVPFTKENAVAFLLEVPELFYELQGKATGRKLFLEDLEEASKN